MRSLGASLKAPRNPSKKLKHHSKKLAKRLGGFAVKRRLLRGSGGSPYHPIEGRVGAGRAGVMAVQSCGIWYIIL